MENKNKKVEQMFMVENDKFTFYYYSDKNEENPKLTFKDKEMSFSIMNLIDFSILVEIKTTNIKGFKVSPTLFILAPLEQSQITIEILSDKPYSTKDKFQFIGYNIKGEDSLNPANMIFKKIKQNPNNYQKYIVRREVDYEEIEEDKKEENESVKKLRKNLFKKFMTDIKKGSFTGSLNNRSGNPLAQSVNLSRSSLFNFMDSPEDRKVKCLNLEYEKLKREYDNLKDKYTNLNNQLNYQKEHKVTSFLGLNDSQDMKKYYPFSIAIILCIISFVLGFFLAK